MFLLAPFFFFLLEASPKKHQPSPLGYSKKKMEREENEIKKKDFFSEFWDTPKEEQRRILNALLVAYRVKNKEEFVPPDEGSNVGPSTKKKRPKEAETKK